MYKPKAASIYLNRDCTRNCPYCNVVDKKRDKEKIHVDSWIECFELLRHIGIDFFLILGTEPLMLEGDLVKLVQYWKREDIEYGFYSTAPQVLFMRRAPSLVQAGLRNWSCGVDFIPEVYEAGINKWSLTTTKLVESQKKFLVKKANDSLNALRYMQGKVPELHAMPTISRMNIEMMPEMIKWLVDNFDNSLHMALNFVEYSRESDMDFATKNLNSFFFQPRDEYLLKELSEEMHKLPQKYQDRVQTSFDYLDNYHHIIKLDWRCKLNCMALSIDCDGTIRQCGYKKLKADKTYYYFDLADRLNEVMTAIELAHMDCKGCYWSYPYALEKFGNDIVNYRSDLWKERDNV